MKFVMIIGDGMADFPQHALGDRTPLEYAYIPNMTYLALNGRSGLATTSYPDLPVGSIVANMALLGYDPRECYPNGRASFEALAQGIQVDEDDVAFRCNLVTLRDNAMYDFTCGNISDGHASSIITNLNMGNPAIRIFPGQSYRNLIVYRNCGCNARDFVCHEPHMNRDRDISEMMLEGKTPEAQRIADELNQLMLDSREQIAKLNELFRTDASMIWLWSSSDRANLPDFFELHGLRGAVVCGLDFLEGICRTARIHSEKVPGATGGPDTDYKAKCKYALKHLKEYDFVLVHVNAPDEEGHAMNPRGKVHAIEQIDYEIIGPIVQSLKTSKEPFRIAVLPDHYTLLQNREHSADPVPVLIYGDGVAPDASNRYSEQEARAVGSLKVDALDMISIFLDGATR